MKLIVLIILLLTSNFHKTTFSNQQSDLSKKVVVSSFLPVDSIVSVRVFNSWTSKEWTLSKRSLNKLKALLRESGATRNLLVKPGHLYIKINLTNNKLLNSYQIYVYPTGIYFDPKSESRLPAYSVSLEKPFNWGAINNAR